MKPGIVITIVASALFIAVMWLVKQGAKAGAVEWGWPFFVLALTAIFAAAYWLDRKPKRPNS
ncbi:MAG: hypothetical protein G4V63_24785 [Candidatus Afipia apatlaquensis]|uniref:Uncharacterized protein n=1 Tax=Candidatus Afipia apatlaquensis TaxID=2712852 RepID=A0A7C9RIM8_9BRAD|nr:hypothetical protein [Candidatus Afipia apatlaquensis]